MIETKLEEGTPEEKARRKIDQLLQDAGWAVQGRDNNNSRVSSYVAVRKFLLDTGNTDYLPFVYRCFAEDATVLLYKNIKLDLFNLDFEHYSERRQLITFGSPTLESLTDGGVKV